LLPRRGLSLGRLILAGLVLAGRSLAVPPVRLALRLSLRGRALVVGTRGQCRRGRRILLLVAAVPRAW
jgi:hypothetical protein